MSLFCHYLNHLVTKKLNTFTLCVKYLHTGGNYVIISLNYLFILNLTFMFTP